MANKFKKGDVVVLKSGGPPMTVDALPRETLYRRPDDAYWTKWFKGASKEERAFSEHLLEKYEPPAKK